MRTIRIASWNVNGLRSIEKKGFVDWFSREGYDIVMIQEVKAMVDQLSEQLTERKGYHAFWNCGERKGYSGVGLYTRLKPNEVHIRFKDPILSNEGRIIQADYDEFTVFNVYFPNGKMREERLNYKLSFYEAFLKECSRLVKQGKQVIVAGDVNTAHTEQDLARPKQNEKFSGFLSQERRWIDRFIGAGFVDSFRALHPDTIAYSYWDYMYKARDRDVGWRIDYIFVSAGLRHRLSEATIEKTVLGSDHCPVTISLRI